MADQLPPGFRSWSKEKRFAYLRHPRHHDRCLCRRYGMLGASVLDDWGLHSAKLCQPLREVILDKDDDRIEFIR